MTTKLVEKQKGLVAYQNQQNVHNPTIYDSTSLQVSDVYITWHVSVSIWSSSTAVSAAAASRSRAELVTPATPAAPALSFVFVSLLRCPRRSGSARGVGSSASCCSASLCSLDLRITASSRGSSARVMVVLSVQMPALL